MVTQPNYGNWLSIDTLDSLDKYILFTMKEPWDILQSKITNKPHLINFNFNMEEIHLNILFQNLKSLVTDNYTIVGIGGGTAIDTAKYIYWMFRKEKNVNLDLILIPSIISVDAFFCSSIAVRNDNKVNYIGESKPNEIIIDYKLIQMAPLFFNRTGVSDTISITSALGDWSLAKDENNERFNQDIFNRAKKIAMNLMNSRKEIKEVTEKGIKALVEGFYREVTLCNDWGNARPEEGSEHFLAYCLESLTRQHYLHGNLIGMNILISLYLQEEYAEFSIEDIKQFFDDINLNWTPSNQNIKNEEIIMALKAIVNYVTLEKLFYSIYNSPRLNLNQKKIFEIIDLINQK